MMPESTTEPVALPPVGSMRLLDLGIFGTIMADPPWPYTSDGPRASRKHRPNSWDRASNTISSTKRYGAMSLEELAELRLPSAPNSHLYLWTTNGFMEAAHDLARAWGYEPKSIVTWLKIRPDGTPSGRAGYYYRGATEHIVFAVKGRLRLQGKTHPNAFMTKRLPHSVKPDYAYTLAEAQSPPPYLEMFARQRRLGWSSWGNEV